MIPLSSRYAWVLTVALTFIAIPVWYHAVVYPKAFSCSNPDVLIRTKALPGIKSFESIPARRHEFYDSAAGTLSLPGRWKAPIRWQLTRTFELQRYYYRPAFPIAQLLPDDDLETRAVMVDGVELPIHVRSDESEGKAVITAYLYILNGQPIRNPFTGAVGAAIAQIREGRLPLTEILVNGRSSFADAPANRQTLVDWIRSAWIRYDEICNP
jgi:hypothetical protein